MNLNITISTSPLGQQGMRGSEPFYIKGQGRVDNLVMTKIDKRLNLVSNDMPW